MNCPKSNRDRIKLLHHTLSPLKHFSWSGSGLLFAHKLPLLTVRSHHLLHLDYPILKHIPPLTSEILCSPGSSASITAPLPFLLLCSSPLSLYPKCKDSPMFCPRIFPCLLLTPFLAISFPLNLQLSPPHRYPDLYAQPDHFLRLCPVFLISLNTLQPDV